TKRRPMILPIIMEV
ncbi:hypothetical protein I8C39_002435, partial [Listeria monocytogenes]|nr:hypothetical protein [Listeria monocytogenes]